MLRPEFEPDLFWALRLTVPLLEARRVRRLPLLCMCLSFVFSLSMCLSFEAIGGCCDEPSTRRGGQLRREARLFSIDPPSEKNRAIPEFDTLELANCKKR